jgi:formylglycine-generating enzyme required for sulfatase activity
MNNIELTDAEWRIDRFVRRFDPSYRLLAMYAAMPVVLTPELLGYLRVEFLRGQVAWIGEADLLLSDLCRSVGYEQYVLQPEVRDVLLAELEEQQPEILERAATLLIQYYRYLARTNRYFGPREQQPQAWSAMLYIAAQRQKVADEIATEFERVGVGLGEMSLSGSAKREMGRLAKIVQDLASKLGDYPRLVAYAELVSRGLKEPQSIEPAALQASYQVGDRVLPSLAKLIAPVTPTGFPGFPPLKSFEFEVLEFGEADRVRSSSKALVRERHEFEVATIVIAPKKRFQKQSPSLIERQAKQDWQYVEALPEGTIELVKIPAGTFLMGAPEDELESYRDEKPQHEVSVAAFYFGKYPVTQAQWRSVAALPDIDRELTPDPSHFDKGDDLPVEQVSWDDAIEFCKRLSVHTGREYRLPSEAEWEYACRAGTTTPFHFGETIDATIANYRAQDWEYKEKTYSGKYGSGKLGEFRERTTDVGSFKVANDFGLYDMHGNVWEWCLDHWHESYEGAPIDGSAWIDENNTEKDAKRLLRGGSWGSDPVNCRSAYRFWVGADNQFNGLGFRVVCAFSSEDSP